MKQDRFTNPKYVVRKGSLVIDIYLQPDGSMGPYISAKRFGTQDAAIKAGRAVFPSDDFGIFACSIRRRF